MTLPIRVLIADDHFVARFGLRGLVSDQPDMEVVGEAKTGAEAVTLYRQIRPDVVLMDIRMPDLDGIQATLAISRDDAGARILIVSSYDTEADVQKVHAAGAAGYVMKEAEPDELLQAIRTVAGGGRHVPPAIAARLAVGATQIQPSPRDLEIVQLIGDGLSNKQIAEKLDLTAGTVRIYVSQILGRLGAANRAEAVTIALRRGLIPPTQKKS